MELDTKEAALFTRLDENSIRHLFREKVIPAKKIKGKWFAKKKDLVSYMDRNKPPEGYIDVLSLARKAGITKTVVFHFIYKKRIKAQKKDGVWIIKTSDAEAFLKSRKIPRSQITVQDLSKKLSVKPYQILSALKKLNIEPKGKMGCELLISRAQIEKIETAVKSAKIGKPTICATIHFRKFGRGEIKGPFLEARSGKHDFGRKSLGRVPLKNIRAETIEAAKKKLRLMIEQQGISEIYDNT